MHQAEEFSAVFSYRKVVRGAFFDLHWRPLPLVMDPAVDGSDAVNPLTHSARIGLVVPKRLAKRSVLRNRIKRLAREVFRHRRVDLPVFDLVLKLGRKPALPEDRSAWNAVLRQDIEAVITRLAELATRQKPQ